jgi:hypothetical protein
MGTSWLKSLRRRFKAERLFKKLEENADTLRQHLGANPNPIPVLVISYNNGVYVENTVRQLQSLGILPIVLDNCSDDPDTQKTLNKLQQAGSAQVVFMNVNHGHLVGFIEPIYKALPEVFAYTDPDLQLSPTLPASFFADACGFDAAVFDIQGRIRANSYGRQNHFRLNCKRDETEALRFPEKLHDSGMGIAVLAAASAA